MTHYKFLDPNGMPRNGGTTPYHLPRGKRPGKWMPKVPVVPCETGYHACREQDLLEWIGPECWEIELRGDVTECINKVVAPEARLLRKLPWDERIARHFICDCAERALAAAGNPDPRSVESIRVARLFAEGKATRNELDAAWDAARAAVWDAAWAAALDAARDAAWVAARVAARDAALDAARDAAWAAAWAAAWVAARDAAWAAAWAAERSWQTRRLVHYLNGGRVEDATQ